MGAPRIWTGQLELGAGRLLSPVLAPLDAGYTQAKVLVRVRGRPLGFVTVPADGDMDRLCQVATAAAEEQLGQTIAAALSGEVSRPELQDSTALDVSSSPISVVVCTRDRPELLRTCLARLAELSYEPFEVIIVDNAPTDSRSKELVTALNDRRFRYVLEPNAGLSLARNRGLEEASHDFVAFTDDDVLVDPGWLSGLLSGLRRSANVACATGFVAAASLDTAEEQYFERHAAWSPSVTPQLFSLGQKWPEAPSFPFSPGLFGTGANFAVDRRAVRQLGGFDERLGAGTCAGGGEDIDLFSRVLLAGHSIAYEPLAVVWHRHRGAPEELDRQLFAWGTGFSAWVTKLMMDRSTRNMLLRRTPAVLAHLTRLWLRALTSGSLFRGGSPLAVRELGGLFVGPAAYLRARGGREVEVRRMRRRELERLGYLKLRRVPVLRALVEPFARAYFLRRFVRTLRQFHDVLSQTPLAGRYWVWGGMLLSWAREGRLMTTVDDGDFAMRLSDAALLHDAVPLLESAGFKRYARFVNNAGRETELAFLRKGLKFEFTLFEEVDGQFEYFVHGWPPEGTVQVRSRIPAQELEEFTFLGRTWLKSVDHELELRSVYGDWETPTKSWWYLADDCAAIDREPWIHPETKWS